MGRLFTFLLTYICVATVLAQAVGFGYAWTTGKLNKDKLFKMLAVVHSIDLDEINKDDNEIKKEEDSVQPSFEEIEKMRSIKSRYIELKMQALEKGLEQVRFVRQQLSEEKSRHLKLKTSFEEKLALLQEGTKKTGYANVRLIWENIPPKQAKEHIMKMVDAGEMEDVVVILADMPIGKRAKIVKTFTEDDEVETLDRILRLIRKGGASSSLIDKTRERVDAN